MTSFDDIYSNVEGYKKDVEVLGRFLEDVCREKQKNADLVAWFRLRKRMVKQGLEPMQTQLNDRISRGKIDKKIIREALDELRIIKKRSDSENKRKLEKSLEEIRDSFPNTLSLKISTSLDDIDTNIAISARTLEQIERDQEAYKKATLKLNRFLSFFAEIRKVSDIDINLCSTFIDQANKMIYEFDLKASALAPVPETYDQRVLDEKYSEIRNQVHQIDSRYPMGLFVDLRRTLRKIIHDIGNDRGIKAFSNRSTELIEYANQAISTFNKKYWQITGQRWERVGTNRWGYRGVRATHEKISLI